MSPFKGMDKNPLLKKRLSSFWAPLRSLFRNSALFSPLSKRGSKDSSKISSDVMLIDKIVGHESILLKKEGETESHSLNEEAYAAFFGFPYLRSLQYESASVLEGLIKEGKRKENKKKLVKMFRWNAALFLEDLIKGRGEEVEIAWINSFLQYGVFSRRDLSALSYIGEYTGMVRRRWRKRDRDNGYIFGYDVGPYGTRYIIDAKEGGNFTRFINHSDTPNLSSRSLYHEGVCHVVFFTNRPIKKGEQLTYDYGPYYWKTRPLPQTL